MMVVLRHAVLISGARLSSFSVPFLFFVAMAPAVADINSWTKPTSGHWEEQAYWSLGLLPDATQSVVFTNAGWKALAIGSQTAQNFPQSMRVQSLRVGAPVDSYNTLLMNFSGFDRGDLRQAPLDHQALRTASRGLHSRWMASSAAAR